MVSIDDVIKSLGKDVPKVIKDQLRDLLASALEDTEREIRKTGEKVSQWLMDRSAGRMSDAEFEALLYSRDITLRQYKLTLQIKARSHLEKIAVGLINLVLDKILGLPFGSPG